MRANFVVRSSGLFPEREMPILQPLSSSGFDAKPEED
jgi:hypothetical protein